MPLQDLPPFLTTREIADLIRLKERKVYDLVATGQIPHVKATGKLLFPRDLVAAWLAQHTEYPDAGEVRTERPPIIAGSSDPLLDWAVRESGSGLAVSWGGSLDGLERFAGGQAMAAGLHVAEDDLEWNVGHVRDRLYGAPVVLIGWARRTQGLVVAPGNPLKLASIADLKGRRVVMRQRQAGAYVLLQRLLGEAGLGLEAIKRVEPPALTEADVAAAIAEGRADAGLAIAAVAKDHGLGFVPIAEEQYDLLIWRSDYFREGMQKLIGFMRTARFQDKAAVLGGYDVSRAGVVRYNAP
jgi:excisionase family DNA binding protein